MTAGARRRGTGAAVLLAVVAVVVGLVAPAGPARAGPAGAAAVRVMTIGDFRTKGADNAVWALAVRARFAAANLRGGITDAGGRRHHVIVLACNSGFDPLRAAACARRAAREHVAAVLGLTSVDTARVWPVLEAAKIPVIGARINTVADATSRVSFPVGCGLPGVFRAMPYLLASSGAPRIGVVISDYGDATDSVLGAVEQGITGAGASAGPVAFVAPEQSSLAEAAATMVRGGADGVIGFVTDSRRGALLRQLGRAGFTGPYVTQAPFGDSPLASDADGTQTALLVGEFAPVTADVPGMRRFRADMDEAPDGASLERTEGAVNNWLAAWIFQRLARTLERIDAASMLRAMGRLEGFDTMGITPPLTTARPGPLLPRMFNAAVATSQVSGGTLPRALGPGFVDVVDGRPIA
jgi:hypothetical protein